jgi:TetR/AcrR family transcriptional regulator, fatty acid metabolism regulator protein
MNTTTELSSHDRILRAGKLLFAENGYENTSTVAIARDAGTSESQLMKHFGSKQGLLVAILDDGWNKVMERIKATISGDSSSERLVHMLTAATIEFENDDRFKVLAALEARRVRRDSTEVVISRAYRRFRELFDQTLLEMQTDGVIRPDLNLDAVRAAIMGFADGLWRDQIVASRAGMSSTYGFEDIRKVLELLMVVFQKQNAQRYKAS